MSMNVVLLQPIIALIAGILILVVPRLLNYIVALYLIIVGVAGDSPIPEPFRGSFDRFTQV